MANEEWAAQEYVTEARARQLAREYGASPDEIEREIARDYRGDTWYRSPAQRTLVSVYDGHTTLADLSDAMARGPLTERQEAMAADFWVMAAAQANTNASAAQNAASARADTEGTTQSLAAFLAADDAAGVAGDILTELQDRAEELNHLAGLAADEHLMQRITRHETVRAIRDELIDRSYHQSLDDNPDKQDEYSNRIWGQAVDLADNGRTLDELRETAETRRTEVEALEEAYYHEQQAQIRAEAAAQREMDGPTGRAWRAAAAITYREHVMDYGNDGRPEDDRHLSASEVAARAMAVATVAGATGVPEGYVLAQLRAAAVAEGSAPGSDNDPDYLAPPDWETFTDRYKSWSALGRAAAARDAEPDTGQPAHSVETAEYWLARGEVDPGAGLSEQMPPEWTPDTGPHWPVEPRWTSEAGQARLEAKWAANDAAYAATQGRLAALPAGERENHTVEDLRLEGSSINQATGITAAQLRGEPVSAATAKAVGHLTDLPPVPTKYTEHPDAHRSGPTTAAAEELAGALRAELADALDQARARLEAGRRARGGPASARSADRACLKRNSRATRSARRPRPLTPTQTLRGRRRLCPPRRPAGSRIRAPPQSPDYAARTTAEPSEGSAADPATTADRPPSAAVNFYRADGRFDYRTWWVTRESDPNPSVRALASAVVDAVDESPRDQRLRPYPDDLHGTVDQQPTDRTAAGLLDDIDQARARSEAGDIPAEREHEQAEYIAHLEEQIDLAAGGDPFPATSTRWQGTDDASAVDGPFSADPVLAAHVAELLSDLDATTLTPYPGDNSAYWDQPRQTRRRVATAGSRIATDGPPLQRRPATAAQDIDGAAAPTLAADEAVPDELARGGDPELAGKTAGWMAAEAAATQRWLADAPAGVTAVDAPDRMVERHDTGQQYAVHPAANPWNTPAKRDDVGVARSAAEQEEITRDGERDHYDSYGTGDPDPDPGKTVQQPPDEATPGAARAADAVAAAHQAVADTQRLHAQRAEQGPAAHWLAADDHAGTVGDEVELGSQDEALPPA